MGAAAHLDQRQARGSLLDLYVVPRRQPPLEGQDCPAKPPPGSTLQSAPESPQPAACPPPGLLDPLLLRTELRSVGRGRVRDVGAAARGEAGGAGGPRWVWDIAEGSLQELGLLCKARGQRTPRDASEGDPSRPEHEARSLDEASVWTHGNKGTQPRDMSILAGHATCHSKKGQSTFNPTSPGRGRGRWPDTPKQGRSHSVPKNLS